MTAKELLKITKSVQSRRPYPKELIEKAEEACLKRANEGGSMVYGFVVLFDDAHAFRRYFEERGFKVNYASCSLTHNYFSISWGDYEKALTDGNACQRLSASFIL